MANHALIKRVVIWLGVVLLSPLTGLAAEGPAAGLSEALMRTPSSTTTAAMITRRRQEVIVAITEVLAEFKAGRSSRRAAANAMRLAGELRAGELAWHLVEHIEFVYTGSSSVSLSLPREAFPALVALEVIGTPAVAPLRRALAEQGPDGTRSLLTRTALISILGCPLSVAYLELEIKATAKEDERRRLGQHLEYLKGDIFRCEGVPRVPGEFPDVRRSAPGRRPESPSVSDDASVVVSVEPEAPSAPGREMKQEPQAPQKGVAEPRPESKPIHVASAGSWPIMVLALVGGAALGAVGMRLVLRRRAS